MIAKREPSLSSITRSHRSAVDKQCEIEAKASSRPKLSIVSNNAASNLFSSALVASPKEEHWVAYNALLQ